jgi:predicted dinucleotide-binding enzyme
MKIGVLGTGTVGQTIGGRLVELGHEVTMGSRQAGNDKAVAWAAAAGDAAHEGSFADAAAFGEVVVNATNGAASIDALTAAGAENLAGKILVDVANVLDVSGAMPPIVGVGTDDSLAEQIQRAFPEARVVKSLNTMNADVMVHPELVPGDHTVFVCGNDEEAKSHVRHMLGGFGWPHERILDLGDITAARGAELYVALWVRLWGATGTGHLNVGVLTA